MARNSQYDQYYPDPALFEGYNDDGSFQCTHDDHTVRTYPNNFTSQAPSCNDAYIAVPSYQGSAYTAPGSDKSGANTSTSTSNAFVSQQVSTPNYCNPPVPLDHGSQHTTPALQPLDGSGQMTSTGFPRQSWQAGAVPSYSLPDLPHFPAQVPNHYHADAGPVRRMHPMNYLPGPLDDASMDWPQNDVSTGTGEPSNADDMSGGDTAGEEETKRTKYEERERDRESRLVAESQKRTAKGMELLFEAKAEGLLVNPLYDPGCAQSRYKWESQQVEKPDPDVVAIIGKEGMRKMGKRVANRRRLDNKGEQHGKSHRHHVRLPNWGSDAALELAIKDETDPRRRTALEKRLVDRRSDRKRESKGASGGNRSGNA
jgi:hypothetical protein